MANLTVTCYKTDLHENQIDVNSDIDTYLKHCAHADYLVHVVVPEAMQAISLPYGAFKQHFNYLSVSITDGTTYYYFMEPTVTTPNTVTFKLTVDKWSCYVKKNGMTLLSGQIVQGHYLTYNCFTYGQEPFNVDNVAIHSQLGGVTGNSVYLLFRIKFATNDEPTKVRSKLLWFKTLTANNNVIRKVADWTNYFSLGLDQAGINPIIVKEVTDVWVMPQDLYTKMNTITHGVYNPAGLGSGPYIHEIIGSAAGIYDSYLGIYTHAPNKRYFFGNGRKKIPLMTSTATQYLNIKASFGGYNMPAFSFTITYNGEVIDFTPALRLNNITISYSTESSVDKVNDSMRLVSTAVSTAGGIGMVLATGNVIGTVGAAVGAGTTIGKTLQEQKLRNGYNSDINTDDVSPLGYLYYGSNNSKTFDGFCVWYEKYKNDLALTYNYDQFGATFVDDVFNYDCDMNLFSLYNKTFIRTNNATIPRQVYFGEYADDIEYMLNKGVRVWTSTSAYKHFINESDRITL